MSVLERCPSYRKSNKRSKEKQGPTLGVRFTEVSVLQKCPLRESRLYLAVFKGKLIGGCIHGAREEGLVVERSLKPKQIDIGFTFINFDPCGAQVEKD